MAAELESKTGMSGLCSPVVDSEGALFVLSTASGGVMAQDGETGTLSEWANTGGQPAGAAFGPKGAMFLADLAHAAIVKWQKDGTQQVVVTEYEGKTLKGPSSVAFDGRGTLYFTDSGALGETTLQSKKGSVFCITGPENSQILRPLALECLAHPCGIAVSSRGTAVYVAEMMTNRILRFAQRPAGVYHVSVFCQLSGGVGPSCLALDETTGVLYVGMYDFAEVASAGTIVAIGTEDGREQGRYSVDGPEITGLALGDGKLVVTEASSGTLQTVTL